uniref:Trifunctional purine biosynthetic protein adenosine-3 n=1 Tax=Petromyzon marinus TaxID=7757 RepID=A0AAJ7UDM9_PETMA|nr:trifunctional purine biosynthetic protein adenosine-3 isoform X2 [Petromyzon marinus]
MSSALIPTSSPFSPPPTSFYILNSRKQKSNHHQPSPSIRLHSEAFRSVVPSDAASVRLRFCARADIDAGSWGGEMDTVLVLGGGAREHVLAWTLAQSPLVKKVIVAPGNGGTATHGGKVENSGVSVANHSLLVQYCADHNVSMVVVGPEAPLAAGVSDDLVAAGVRCFGPSARAARLESSKAFAKAFMDRHGIPTARWAAFTEARAACAYINSTEPAPLVVKASGLAGGKGVVVARDREEACRVVVEIMQDRVHGDAGETVLVEEVLEGEEISCMCFTDGRSVVMMPPAQDHKRVGEGDTGPNTGGMGAYAPTPQVPADFLSMVQRCVLQKTVDGMMEEGNPYIGVLYAGLMLTKAGPKVLEFNCRFGDPECQVLLPLLKSDVYAVVRACASGGSLADERVEWWSGRSAVTVVMASRGYPGDAPTGFPIAGISRAQELGCLVFHGATKTRAAGVGGGAAAAGGGGGGAGGGGAGGGAAAAAAGDDDDDGWRQQLVTSGGRVLSVTAVGRDLRAALALATSGVAAIHFQGAFHRRDIAHRGLAEGPREAAPLLPPLTYAGSGVDIDAADALVTSIKPLAAATARPGCGSELGGFGAFFDLKAAGFTDPILVSGTDGVGTKLKVAEECGRLEGVGQDLVAMCVNDVLCHGAEPLFFLDYLSCGRLHPPSARRIIGGIARACSLANCSLAGGETAEMPGAYPPGAHDLAGFAVGAVERARCLPRLGAVRAGDAVVAVASSGLHSNGFSLARRVVERAGAAYGEPAPFCADGTTLGEALLVPTRIYVRSLLPVLRGDAVHSVSHITGGGLPGNVTRGLPPGLGATLDASLWEVAPVFGWLWRAGHVPEQEMARTFNLGVGAALVCHSAAAPGVVDALREAGERAWVVGQVVPVDKGEERIKITGLTSALEAAWVPPGSEVTTKPKVRVAVLISGTGTNLQALVEHTRDATRASVCEVVLVVSNIPGAAGLARATRANIATRVCDHRQYGSRSEFESDIDGVLAEFSVDVVCLAGFMRILTPPFVRKWQGRMLNIHPSLLPAFRGTHALRQALQAGARVTGCTVHFVSEEVDTGGIVAQEAVAVETGDTEETLGARVREAEHRAFPAALELVARGNATLVNGRVVWV